MLPWAVSIVAVGAMVAVLLAAVAQGFAARGRASAAADAAALAAAAVTFRPFGSGGDPEAEAARFSREHGAALVSCICAVDRSYAPRRVTVTVEVVVDVMGFGRRVFRAVSRAELDPVALLVDG